MAYSVVPTVATGDLWTAANHNTYVRDNFAAGVPDIFTIKGDLIVGSGADGAGRLPAGADGYGLKAASGQTLGMKYAGQPIPIGGILIWSGAIVDIPAGWQICDGSGGTPNLRDKFVVGAGSTYAVGATGGATTHDHTQGNTGNESSHTHQVSGNTGNSSVSDVVLAGIYANAADVVHAHAVSISSQAGAAHAHSNPTTATGSSLAPYYALAYIMRTA